MNTNSKLADIAWDYVVKHAEIEGLAKKLPGGKVSWTTARTDAVVIQWLQNPQYPEWGYVSLGSSLAWEEGHQATLVYLNKEINHPKKLFPPPSWDHWKAFGMKPTLKRGKVIERYHELSKTWEIDVAYGRILGELWAKGVYK